MTKELCRVYIICAFGYGGCRIMDAVFGAPPSRDLATLAIIWAGTLAIYCVLFFAYYRESFIRFDQ